MPLLSQSRSDPKSFSISFQSESYETPSYETPTPSSCKVRHVKISVKNLLTKINIIIKLGKAYISKYEQ